MNRLAWILLAAAFLPGCGNPESCWDEESCVSTGVGWLSSPAACVPKSCAEQHLTCGPVPDGCGRVLDCGTCLAPDSCGGAGVANVCGRSNCNPGICALLFKNCGEVPDGCGGTVNCGVCNPGFICGAGGLPNVCGQAT
jgi:hypothetical protein